MANLTRREKQSRAYTLAVVGAGSGVVAAVFLVLAIVGITSLGPAFLAALVAGGAAFAFRRTVGS